MDAYASSRQIEKGNMTRTEHLQWCKDRAIEELPDTDAAFASFQSDMRKHDETRDHVALLMMNQMYFGGMLWLPQKMKQFIEDFN